MKEMEAKTENRYEYRKPQEKRKHMIAPDLFGLNPQSFHLYIYLNLHMYRIGMDI